MEILENSDSIYERLEDIPSGECFRNIHNNCIYLKTQSTADNGASAYGCVDLLDGKICYIFSDQKVIPVHATLLINHNREDK